MHKYHRVAKREKRAPLGKEVRVQYVAAALFSGHNMQAIYKKGDYVNKLIFSTEQTHNKPPCPFSVEDLMWEWSKTTVNKVKENTAQKYDCLIRNHIAETAFGAAPIRDVTGKEISKFADDRLLSVSGKTVNDILAILNLAFAYASEEYQIKKPKIRRVKEPIKEMRVLSRKEQQVLEEYLTTDVTIYKLGILIALYTGIRIGELCALQWTDITDESISINKTMYRGKSEKTTAIKIGTPKTPTSNRTIPTPVFLLPFFEQFRRQGSLLVNRKGKPVEPRLLQQYFSKTIKILGIEQANFHSLRHTFATRCIEAGFDIKTLSEIMGHADVKTTLNKYVHSSFEQKQKNMQLLKPFVDMRK